MLKNIAKKILPERYYLITKKIIGIYLYDYSCKSYSQEGEDLLLKRIFNSKKNGFYVDVGAHHPKRFSNTYLFYKMGWSGINIDPMPGSMRAFNQIRPKDINLELAISDKNETLTYYAFNEPALNGFCKELSEIRNGLNEYKIIFQKEIDTKKLSDILDSSLPKECKIDILSIDVEGLDFQVLRSNNWEKYLPTVILVEILGKTLQDIYFSDISTYLTEKGYELFAKTYNTVIFKKIES